MKTDCHNKKRIDETKDSADFPGVTIDMADDEKVDKELVKERTTTLDNNPRDTDDKNM